MTEPTEQTTDQPSPSADVDPDLRRRHQEARLELWQARQRAELAVYEADQQALDAPVPTTARQRLAYARELARSGLVPAGFRGGAKAHEELNERQERVAAASIVLATEWGEQLGFHGLAALQNLQVVEGNLGVKPKAARGMIQAAGHELFDHCDYSKAGFPIAWTVSILRRRPDGTADELKSVTFRIEQALRARLISEIKRDEAGEIVDVVARSDKGRPLPWELYTEDMLQNRATSRLVNLYASDVCGGMDLASDLPEPLARPSGTEPPPKVAETLASLPPAAPEPAGEAYDPLADITEIRARLGIPDGRRVPWWEHADARERLGVRRRSIVQRAADQISEWVLANPDEAEAIDIKPERLRREKGAGGSLEWALYPPDLMDAEIEDEPAPMPSRADLEADARRDGDEIGADRFAEHRHPATMHIGPDAFDDGDPAPVQNAESRPASRAADLLEVIDRLAERAGQQRAQYCRRAIALYQANPEDWTEQQMAEFIHQMEPGVSVEELIGA